MSELMTPEGTERLLAAIDNPPRFYPGDRVQVRGNIETQNHATVAEGPRDGRYLIALDHRRYIDTKGDVRQVESWCDAKLLTHVEACTCGTECGEGVEHEAVG